MTHRLVLLIGVWVFLVLPAAWLAWCSHRGFDPGMCEAYGACGWRHA